MHAKNEKIICPKCGQECSWITHENGRIFCVHYEGYEKTPEGKIKKKIKKHYMGLESYKRGRPGEQYTNIIDKKIGEIEQKLKEAKSEEEKRRLEKALESLKKTKERIEERRDKANIHLRPITDENRFFEYIKESLQLMKLQPGFNEDKITKVLDIIENFLKENKEMLSEKTLAKVRLIENDVIYAIYSRR